MKREATIVSLGLIAMFAIAFSIESFVSEVIDTIGVGLIIVVVLICVHFLFKGVPKSS